MAGYYGDVTSNMDIGWDLLLVNREVEWSFLGCWISMKLMDL